MATTLKNFVTLSSGPLTGSGYAAAGVLVALSPSDAAYLAARNLAAIVDKYTVDFATAGYSKNGAFVLNLAASTPVTADFTSLSSLAVTAGDTTFASWKEINFKVISGSVTVSPGASNALTTPLGGSSPTQTMPASSQQRWHAPAGVAVDSTHKNLKFDPGGSPAVIVVCVGGS